MSTRHNKPEVFPGSTKNIDLQDRLWYDTLVKDVPGISDLDFSTLMMWWNQDNQLEISSLNDNLLIRYVAGDDPVNSGWSVIGGNRLSETFDTLFTYLRDNNEPVRIVHVPEFVIDNNIDCRDNYTIEGERDYDEYILSTKDLSSLEGPEHSRTRRKVRRFLRETDNGERVGVVSFDLGSRLDKARLLDSMTTFPRHGRSRNDSDDAESSVLEYSIDNAKSLGLLCLVVTVDRDIHGFAIYSQSLDGRYYITHHLKANDTHPHTFDYITQQLALVATGNGIPYLNFEMDLGIEGLRFHKMGLRPVDFFRKYTITPSDNA